MPAVRHLGVRVLLALAVVYAVVRGLSYARTWRGLDYYQFWVVGQAAARSGAGADVYSEEERRRIGADVLLGLTAEDHSDRLAAAASRRKVLETYSTPFLYTLTGTLASGRYDTDHLGFVLVSLACGIGGVLALCHRLRYPPLASASAIVALTELYAPWRSDLRVGNVNGIQLGLLAGVLGVLGLRGRPWRDVSAGAILGTAVAFKPNLAFVAVLMAVAWALDRRFATLRRASAGFALAVTGAFAASSIFFGGPRCWASWISALRSMPGEIIGVRIGNFSLAHLVGDAAGVKIAPVLALLLLAASLSVLALGRERGRTGNGAASSDEFVPLGVGCLVALLSSPLVWVHYFVLAIPLALWLLRPAGDEAGGWVDARRLLAGIAVVLLATRPLELIVGQGRPALAAATANAGALMLFGLALAERLRRRAPSR
ncbi:MAG: hypothetical protein LAO51_11380 [Acidobacteriia bacterium]|nr:hypothetical protein [Terriglobia bacterium]